MYRSVRHIDVIIARHFRTSDLFFTFVLLLSYLFYWYSYQSCTFECGFVLLVNFILIWLWISYDNDGCWLLWGWGNQQNYWFDFYYFILYVELCISIHIIPEPYLSCLLYIPTYIRLN